MIEEQSKKKKVLPIVTLICVAIMVIAIGSYALWQMTKKQQNKNVIGTACLSIDLDLAGSWPMSEEEALEKDPYQFTITNNCDTAVNYQVALESLFATGNESSNYLDYNYVRVKIDEEESKTYDELTGITNDTGVRTTKEITHHTLAGNDNTTHQIRIWVDIDTPLKEEDNTRNDNKYFYGKVKIIAGQGIEGDPEINQNLRVVSTEGEPIARLNNISVGDRLGYEGEEFYVVGIDGNNVKLLSRYLLNVGDHKNPNVAEGLQNAELGITRPSLTSSPVTYGDYPYYGAVSFSSSSYWYNNGWISPYTQNSFIYNENASISTYVNGYVQTLQTMGLSVTNGTLLSLEEVSALCNTTITSYGNYSSQCPSYLFETGYWLGSAYGTSDDGGVWDVLAYGNLGYSYYHDADNFGVRPVITISLS